MFKSIISTVVAAFIFTACGVETDAALAPTASSLPSRIRSLNAPQSANLAEAIWTRQTTAEGLAIALVARFGKPAMQWVVAAETAASLAAVSYGTLTEGGDGTMSYVASPTDRLIVRPAIGDAFELQAIHIQDPFSAVWVTPRQQLQVTVSPGVVDISGWVEDEEGNRVTVSLADFSVDGPEVVTGSVHFGTESVQLNYSSAIAGKHFEIADEATVTTREGLFTVSYTYALSQTGGLERLKWEGTISKNGAVIGSLEKNVIAHDDTHEVIEREVHVNDSTFDVGRTTVALGVPTSH